MHDDLRKLIADYATINYVIGYEDSFLRNSELQSRRKLLEDKIYSQLAEDEFILEEALEVLQYYAGDDPQYHYFKLAGAISVISKRLEAMK